MASPGSACGGNVSYGVCIPSFSCRYILLIPRQFQCEFANRTADCGDEHADLRYILHLFCSFNNHDFSLYLGVLALLFNLVIFLHALNHISEFLVPNVCHVSRALGVSDTLVGGALLGFCHAAPDLFTSFVAAKRSQPELVLVYVLGKGLFLTTLVVAVALATMRFRVYPGKFRRHMFALAAATLLILYSTKDDAVFLWEPVAYFFVYFLYVICLLSMDWLYTKEEKMVAVVAEIVNRENESRVRFVRSDDEELPTPSQRRSRRLSSIVNPVRIKRKDREMIQRPAIWESDSFFDSNEYWRYPVFAATSREARVLQNSTTLLHRQLRTPLSKDERGVLYALELHMPTPLIPRARKIARKAAVNCALDLQRRRILKIMELREQSKWGEDHRDVVAVEIGRTRVVESKFGVFESFFDHLVPVDEIEWAEASCFGRLTMMLEAPIFYFCKLAIPCVDGTVLLNNWCQLLNCLHCVSVPIAFLWAFHVFRLPLDKAIPITTCTVIAGILLAVLVLLTSRTHVAPSYHMAFAVAGIAASLCLTYLLVSECIDIFTAFGNIFNVHSTVIYGTFLVWGMSLSQVMNTTALTKAGYPRVALHSLFSGGVFTMLVGMGIACLVMIIFNGHNLLYNYTSTHRGFIVNELFYMMASLGATLIIVPTFAYEIRSPHGWLLLVIYTMFLSMIFLSEYDIIHPLGQ